MYRRPVLACMLMFVLAALWGQWQSVFRCADGYRDTAESVIGCERNLRDIEFATVSYSIDYGYAPASLIELVPAYLDAIPDCPSAGCDTYSSSYLAGRRCTAERDEYYLCCRGRNHIRAGLDPNMPERRSYQFQAYPESWEPPWACEAPAAGER